MEELSIGSRPKGESVKGVGGPIEDVIGLVAIHSQPKGLQGVRHRKTGIAQLDTPDGGRAEDTERSSNQCTESTNGK